VVGHGLEDRLDDLGEVQALAEEVAHLEGKSQLLDLAADAAITSPLPHAIFPTSRSKTRGQAT